MPLPELIEVVPPTGPVEATITVPGSKSLTNRALVLAALADRPVRLLGALWSEDTRVMVSCLTRLGIGIEVDPDPGEDGNRHLRVTGCGGRLSPGGTESAPVELFVENAGTAARFLAAVLCLGQGVYRLDGVPRMRQRPQAALFTALRELGYRVDAPGDFLPACIHGVGPRPGRCRVTIDQSSQFASALLLAGERGGWEVEVVGENLDESPYVAMTLKLREAMAAAGEEFRIDPDASSGSYFHAAQSVLPAGSHVAVSDWPANDWQVDARFPKYLPLPGTVSRQADLGDSIMTAIVLAPWAAGPVQFTDLGRLRVQECERVAALRTELGKCGVKVEEEGDTLIVHPTRPHGAVIDTYEDHRVAMCFAILGLKVPGIRLQNPACVRKTFPNFFSKLALPSPRGLGVSLLSVAGSKAVPLEPTDWLPEDFPS